MQRFDRETAFRSLPVAAAYVRGGTRVGRTQYLRMTPITTPWICTSFG